MDPIYSELNEHGVATLTINRPHRANAINDEVIYSMITALDDLASNGVTRLLIIKSTGLHFSAGLDTYWQKHCIDNNELPAQNISVQMSRLYATLYDFPHPTLVVVKGRAYSDAVGLIACCDFVLADHNSEFILNDLKYGVPPALPIPYLIKSIGERAAKQFALLCKPLTAIKAFDLGLVTCLASSDQLSIEEQKIITSLLQHDRDLASATKSLIQFCADEPFDDTQIDYSIEIVDEMKSKPAFRLGLEQIIQKHTNRNK